MEHVRRVFVRPTDPYHGRSAQTCTTTFYHSTSFGCSHTSHILGQSQASRGTSQVIASSRFTSPCSPQPSGQLAPHTHRQTSSFGICITRYISTFTHHHTAHEQNTGGCFLLLSETHNDGFFWRDAFVFCSSCTASFAGELASNPDVCSDWLSSSTARALCVVLVLCDRAWAFVA